MVNYNKKLVTIFGHRHSYIKHTSRKKRKKWKMMVKKMLML